MNQLELLPLAQAFAQAPHPDSGWLSSSEQQRLVRLRVETRRRQYLAGHWLARVLLAERHGGQPQSWQLEERENLPPAVLGLDQPCWLSLSHSGDWLACAIAEVAIGIDLEQRPRKHTLSSVEALLLAADEAPGSLDADGLLQRWVAKEALIKQRHASALPERLAQLILHPAEPGGADVRVLSATGYHLGIAAPESCPLRIRGLADEALARCWRVVDLGCEQN